MAFTKSYNPRAWKNKDNQAIKKGASAVKRKFSNATDSFDDLVTRRAPIKAEELIGNLKRGMKKVGPAARYATRSAKVAKQGVTGNIKSFLSKLFKKLK